jgi:hypothetical protein
LDPDIVVLFFDLSDVHDDLMYSRIARFDTNGHPVGVPAAPEYKGDGGIERVMIAIKDFFKEHTRLYNFVRLRISRFLEVARHAGKASADIRFDKYAMLRPDYAARDDEDWKLSYKYMLFIRDLLEEHGVEFWIVVYPYGMQVGPTEYVSGREFWGFKKDTVYSTAPQGFVERFGRKNGIRVINMCEDFRQHSTRVSSLYLDYNGHWYPSGHELVASILERALTPSLVSRHELAVK